MTYLVQPVFNPDSIYTIFYSSRTNRERTLFSAQVYPEIARFTRQNWVEPGLNSALLIAFILIASLDRCHILSERETAHIIQIRMIHKFWQSKRIKCRNKHSERCLFVTVGSSKLVPWGAKFAIRCRSTLKYKRWFHVPAYFFCIMMNCHQIFKLVVDTEVLFPKRSRRVVSKIHYYLRG